MCRTSCRSFWSSFDVNRFILDEDMREKRFLHFHSQWPWPLTFKPQICSTSYSYPALCFHWSRSFYGFPTSTKSEARSGQTDRPTDRRSAIQYLMRPPSEVRITRTQYRSLTCYDRSSVRIIHYDYIKDSIGQTQCSLDIILLFNMFRYALHRIMCLSLFHLIVVSAGFSETYATTAEGRGSPIPRSGSVERISGSVDAARSRSQSPSRRILSSAVDADLIQASLREHSKCIIQIERERVGIYVCQQFWLY